MDNNFYLDEQGHFIECEESDSDECICWQLLDEVEAKRNEIALEPRVYEAY